MTTPSMRERLGRGPDATAVLLALRADPHPVALVGSWAAGTAVVAAAPVRVARGAQAVWAALAEPHVVAPGDATVGGAWIGSLAFGLGATIESLDPPPPRPVPGPDGWLGFYDHLLLRDADGVWWFEGLPADAARADVLRERREELRERLGFGGATTPGSTGRGAAGEPPGSVAVTTSRAGGRGAEDAPRAAAGDARIVDARIRAPGYAGHAAAVAAAVEAIGAGEVFQANLCLRVEGRLEGAAIDLFARTARATHPAFGAYVDAGERQLVSLSPERFLRRERATVVATPIKGTAAGDTDPAHLAASAKDRAEHVMIVDLMRNDLGRVCAFGTVRADPQPRVEAHPGVWHLVSDVRGRLRDGVTDTDLLRATFPPGSVTGAPKVQALRVIARLEATGREAYTGAIGLVSPLAGLELNVAIRTFEVAGDRVWLGAGGGIVADSDPAAETVEAWRKAAPLIAAAGGELAPPAGAVRAGAGPVPLAPGPRPDPGRGVFETVLVRDGVAVRLEAHLARLRASVAAVYAAELDVDAVAADVGGTLARLSTAGAAGARLRIRWTPVGGVALQLAPPGPARDAPVALTPVVLPGGLGAHKWADRAVIGATPGTPLFLDLDGAVLEAGWATVWVLEGDRLVTPPADGRILPGVTRAALLAAPGLATAEAPLDLQRLRDADAVLLTAAVSLAAEATLPGGRPPGAGRDLVSRLRALLSDPSGAAR